MARTKDWSDLPPELIGKIILKLYELLCQEAGVERDDGDPWRLSSHEIRDEVTTSRSYVKPHFQGLHDR